MGWQDAPIVSSPNGGAVTGGGGTGGYGGAVPAQGAPMATQAPPAWQSAPIVQSGPQGPQLSPAETRYQAALNEIRRTQFPDMPDEQWREYSSRAFGPSLNNQSEQIATFGFADEIGAGLGALGSQARQWTGDETSPGFGDAFGAYQELENARLDLSREQNGALGTAAEFATGMGIAAPATKAMFAAAGPAMSTFEQAIRGGVAGAGSAGVYGFGATEGGIPERLQGALTTGTAGAGLGFAAPFAGQLVGNTVGRLFKRNRPPAPNLGGPNQAASGALRSEADDLFKALNESSVSVTPEAFRSLYDDMAGLSIRDRFKPGFDKKTAKFLKELADAVDLNRPIHLADLHVLRQQAQALLRKAKGRDTHFLNEFVDQIDEFAGRLRPDQIVGGGPESVNDLFSAISLWAKSKRSTTIEDAIYNASLSGSGLASGLRSEFTKLLRAKNGTSQLSRSGFSNAEIREIEKFVQGGPLTGFLNTLAGARGIMGSISGGVAGGPAAAMGVPVAGAGARAVLNRNASGASQNVLQMVSGGAGNPPIIPQVPYLPSLLAPGAAPMLTNGAGG